MPILSIENLSKHFGSIKAVENISLEVKAGQVLGILGPNGSGKTTTLGMILGIIRPSSGHYHWFDQSKKGPVGRYLGTLLETPNFYPYLNAEENLAIIRHIKRSKEASFESLLDLVKLSHRRRARFDTYSLGMKQRLALAASMVGDPDVLILDEPTNGLDPEGIADVRNTIIEIAQSGKTVIMASHILMEVEKVCTHVAILKSGRLLADGPVGMILSKDTIYEIGGSPMEALLVQLRKNRSVKEVRLVGNHCEIKIANDLTLGDLNHALVQAGIKIDHLVEKTHRLEEEFLEIIK